MLDFLFIRIVGLSQRRISRNNIELVRGVVVVVGGGCMHALLLIDPRYSVPEGDA